MKFLTTAFLFFYMVINWMVGVVVAYTPSFTLMSSKKQQSNGGFYGRLSGIIRSGSIGTLFKRDATLNMVAGYRPEERSGVSFWGITNALLPNLKPSRKTDKRKVIESESGLALSSMVMIQSAELNRVRKNSYSYTEVAGFMEYDPKVAAKTAHKRKAQSSLNSRSGGWFRM